MSVGLKLLASLIDCEDGVGQFAKLRLSEQIFMGEVEVESFRFFEKHVRQYGKMPSRTACKESGLTLLPGKQPEPPKYYHDKLRERYVFYQLRDMLKSVEGQLNDDQPAQALERMSGTLSLCELFRNRDRIFDFAKDALPLVLGEYHQKLHQGEDYGLRLGWPTFDAMTGGLMGGDLITVVGRPGAGKTYLMMHAANTAWRAGKVPLFISMEMKPLLIMQRAAAMLAKVPITGIKHAALPTQQQQHLQTTLKAFRKGKFPYWVVDGALTATVDDVLLLAHQLNPGAVFIDGAYLLRTPNSRLSRWERLSETAERIKSELAEGLNIPVAISYQFNRQVRRGQKPGSAGLEDIAYTDAIGQLSSVVLGMLQEESVETLTRRRIEILKGRSGEQGHFNIHWLFDQGPNYMDFSEVTAPLPVEHDSGEDMHYL